MCTATFTLGKDEGKCLEMKRAAVSSKRGLSVMKLRWKCKHFMPVELGRVESAL